MWASAMDGQKSACFVGSSMCIDAHTQKKMECSVVLLRRMETNKCCTAPRMTAHGSPRELGFIA